MSASEKVSFVLQYGERFFSVAGLIDTAGRNFSLLRHSLQNLADCCRIINE
jgi:hypothetical protein